MPSARRNSYLRLWQKEHQIAWLDRNSIPHTELLSGKSEMQYAKLGEVNTMGDEKKKEKGKAEEVAEKSGEVVGKGVKKGFGIAKGIGKGLVKGVKGEEEKKKEKE